MAKGDFKGENFKPCNTVPLYQARFYYTKRCADKLKAEAEKKAAKEEQRLRLEAIDNEDKRQRYEIVEHVRNLERKKTKGIQKSVVEEVAEKA